MGADMGLHVKRQQNTPGPEGSEVITNSCEGTSLVELQDFWKAVLGREGFTRLWAAVVS